MRDPQKRITILVLAFLVLMACFVAQVMRQEQKFLVAETRDFRLAETTYLPPNEVLKVLALGYDPFVSDMLFMQANSYFATHLMHDRKYHWLDNYLGAIVGYCRDRFGRRLTLVPDECEKNADTEWIAGLFPFNPRVYLWTSQVIKFAPYLRDSIIDKSVYYGKTGIHYCPDNWEIYFDVGFNLYFEYRELPQEQKEALKREALNYFSVASNLPDSSIDPNFVTGTLWSKEETERAITQVYMTYYHASERQKKEMRTRVRAYGEGELADLFEREEIAWQEQFPYLPQSLFHVLGKPGK